MTLVFVFSGCPLWIATGVQRYHHTSSKICYHLAEIGERCEVITWSDQRISRSDWNTFLCQYLIMHFFVLNIAFESIYYGSVLMLAISVKSLKLSIWLKAKGSSLILSLRQHFLIVLKRARSVSILNADCSVAWGCRICWQHLCRLIRTPANNKFPGCHTKLHLIIRLQFWSFEESGVPIHCHYSQTHYGPDWLAQSAVTAEYTDCISAEG